MITEEISKSKSLISTVIPHVRALLNIYLSSASEEDSGVKKLKTVLRNLFQNRFLNLDNTNVFDSKIFVVSTK